MRRALCLKLFFVCVIFVSVLPTQARTNRNEKVDARVNQILLKMTLEEKVGQLSQLNFDNSNVEADIAAGKVGSLLNATGAEQVNKLQRIAVEKSRLHIPILFGYDVIHGYRTIFPIPLGLASSWDTTVVERMARISASEASAAGIRWTFSPMVDVARDPRWGRIAEGAGEDPYLGSQLAIAYVRGYQGNDLSDPANIAACAKHFVGYGAAEGGRDYNSVDMSEGRLREVYLPPFKAALDAGARTFMSSFNTLNGVPASANTFTLRKILKEEWKFSGFVVSDFNSIGELLPHGVAADRASAAQQAFTSGVDMDMTAGAYIDHLAALVREGKVPLALIDDAVRRILRVKVDLGLFEHPYADATKESERLMTSANLTAARGISQKSMVLLKNEADVLPFSKTVSSVAVIGPLADSKADMLGNWFGKGEASNVVTVLEGIRAHVGSSTRVLYSKGGEVMKTTSQEISDAVATAKQADVTLLVLGETGDMSGEASSRADVNFPGDQQKLLEAVVSTGKPVALVVMSGRPLTLSWAAQNVPAILQAWFPGTQAGHAVADIIFGDVNPSGKLPVSFPRSLGQVPIYYSALSTGRPLLAENDKKYRSAYLDSPNTPLFPFGHGLSYTKFAYSDLRVTSPDEHGQIKATVEVRNVGTRAGDEIVQLYLRGSLATVARPVRELKGFQRISLVPGESRKVTFILDRDQLGFWDANMRYTVQSGKYSIFVGASSEAVLEASFNVRTSVQFAAHPRHNLPTKRPLQPSAGAGARTTSFGTTGAN